MTHTRVGCLHLASYLLDGSWGANSNSLPLLLHLLMALITVCTRLEWLPQPIGSNSWEAHPDKAQWMSQSLKAAKALLCQGSSGKLLGACEKLRL